MVKIKMSYYLGAGTSVPLGDLNDGWKMGFHGYGRMDFAVSPKLDVLAGADYHFFSLEDQPDTSVEGGTFSTINLTGDFKVNLGTPDKGANPYLLGGIGLAIQNISDSSFAVSAQSRSLKSFDTKTNALIEIGGGVELKTLFIQGRYVNILSDSTSISYIPITVGVKF